MHYHELKSMRRRTRKHPGSRRSPPVEDRPWLPIPEPPQRPPKEESADRDRGVVIIPMWDPEVPEGS